MLLAAVGFLGACESRAPRDSDPRPSSTDRGDSLPLRGIVVLGDGSPTFRACGDDAPRTLADSTNGVLRGAVDVLGGPGQPVYVEGLGRVSGTSGDEPPARGQPADGAAEAAATLVQVRRAVPLGEGSGCDQQATAALVVARGNEPFWHVAVLPDRIVFREPDAPDGIEFAPAAPVRQAGRVIYRSIREGAAPAAIELLLEDRGCTDSMSGEYMHLSAMAQVDGRTLSGCAYEPILPRGPS